MKLHGSVIAVLSAFSLAAADCCTIDDPIGPFRTCSPLVSSPEKSFLVKAINYTRYHDDLGGGTFDPDPAWNSVTVYLARTSNRQCAPGEDTGCNVSGPVCKLIDCSPLSQDASRATNGGGSLITDLTVSVPDGAGPDGAYYDLASSLFDRHDGRGDLSQSVWRQIPYQTSASSLEYDNNWYGFNMTGMRTLNGTNEDGFFPYEVASGDSWPGFKLHTVPCAAYACARSCVHAAWSSGTDIDVDSAKDCIDQCEGVDDVVNYCPDVGGKTLDIVPKDLGFDSQSALDAYVPDGCAKFEAAAFPQAHASYTASVASASSAALATSTSATAATATASSGAVSGRRVEAVRAGAVLGAIPAVVKVIFAL